MNYFDQHVHCSYSFDSHASLGKYIRKAIKNRLPYFVVTDHADFDYLTKGHDEILNLEARHKRIVSLQKQYPEIKLLEGIEVGYTRGNVERMKELANYEHLSLINLSVHTSDNMSFYHMKYFEEDPKGTVEKYFELLLEAINSGVDFDVLCHFDYGFKTARYVIPDLKLIKFEKSVKKIFKRLIELDKCLEINAKCQQYINDEEHTRYFLKLYKELGGKNITISSDAHAVRNLCFQFSRYFKIVKECGFNELCYFVNRKRHTFVIE